MNVRLMKLFKTREIQEARHYVAMDPQACALHLHFMLTPDAPTCFKAAVGRGEPIAHLFSQDKDLLTEIALRAGVRVIYIDKEGTPSQHIDLCGKPLALIMQEMGEDISEHVLAKQDRPKMRGRKGRLQ